jgi:histidine ammonia-lyase
MKIDHLHDIAISDVINVAIEKVSIDLTAGTLEAVTKSHDTVEAIIKKGKPVYGINTGFGVFADRTIDECSIQKLNRNLIVSHAVGTGNSLDEQVVRAAMFIRAVTLAKGYSGVRPEIILTLLAMLNRGVTPVVPEKGSLGSSGDLCQLSHMALVLSKDEQDLEHESGRALYENLEMSGKAAMSLAGIERVILTAKEGLAINNGATFSAALGALAVYEAAYLVRVAEIAAALSMEALCARSDFLDPRIHATRRQLGQIQSAINISKQLKNSTLLDSLSQVQDAYSLRCAPQVIGAVRDTIEYTKTIVEREINAVTDNPLIFENEQAISGGNFHGEPVGLVMDYLSIALSELGANSERRSFRLTDENLSNGLPPMLVNNTLSAGLNSGLMLPHYTAASLVLENQTLATPDSIRSLPTSANQEDHNSNAMTAARHAYEIVGNLRQILSIELYAAVRGIELRLKVNNGRLGEGTGATVEKMSKIIPFIQGDTLSGEEIAKVNRLLKEHKI